MAKAKVSLANKQTNKIAPCDIFTFVSSHHTLFSPTELEVLTQHVNLFLPELPWPLHLTSLLEVLQTKWLAPSLALLIRHITWLLFLISLNVIGICEAFERHVWDYILCSWLSTASCFKCVVLQRTAFESVEHVCLAHTMLPFQREQRDASVACPIQRSMCDTWTPLHTFVFLWH